MESTFEIGAAYGLSQWLRSIVRATIFPAGRGRFNPSVGGEQIVTGSREPELAACRVLLGQGITGTLVTRHHGEDIDAARINIERGAQLTVPDEPRVGFRKWSADVRFLSAQASVQADLQLSGIGTAASPKRPPALERCA